jgi:hypothetical protein
VAQCASQADPRCGCVYTCVIRLVCVDNLFLVEVRYFHVDSFVLLFFVEWGTDVIGGPLGVGNRFKTESFTVKVL